VGCAVVGTTLTADGWAQPVRILCNVPGPSLGSTGISWDAARAQVGRRIEINHAARGTDWVDREQALSDQTRQCVARRAGSGARARCALIGRGARAVDRAAVSVGCQFTYEVAQP